MSSPRTWGCFFNQADTHRLYLVFPTHVGVFHETEVIHAVLDGLPHARGGVSKKGRRGDLVGMSSPRTWGCFRSARPTRLASGVFPTHVGVFLSIYEKIAISWRLPHARGGDSTRIVQTGTGYASSPRTWGCFAWTTRVSNPVCVFATHVGVFPPLLSTRWHSFCLHHVRGVFLVRGLPALAYWSLPYTCGT